MNWEALKSFIDTLTNNPTFVAVVTTLTALLPLFAIFSKTSYGKKAIKSLTSLYRLGDEKATQTLEKVKNVETLAKEKIAQLEAYYEQKVEDLQSEYEKKAAALISVANFYVESLFAVADQIPNKKVQELVLQLKSQYEDKKLEISQVIDATYQDIQDNFILAKQEVKQEYDEKIDYLENKINELTLFLNEVKGEKVDGE